MANVDFARQNNSEVQNRNKSDWQKALDSMSIMALAKGADAQSMLGFALGKWLSNYLNRGSENADTKKYNSLITGNGKNGSGLNESLMNENQNEALAGTAAEKAVYQPTQTANALLGDVANSGLGAYMSAEENNPMLKYGDAGSNLYGMALQEAGLKDGAGNYAINQPNELSLINKLLRG